MNPVHKEFQELVTRMFLVEALTTEKRRSWSFVDNILLFWLV